MKKCTKVLYDNDSQKVMVSGVENYGDFNFRFAVKIMYLEEYMSEDEVKEYGKYDVSLLAVSPESAGEENVNKAFESMGIDEEYRSNELVQYESLIEYGIFAVLASVHGNNLGKLLSEINNELKMANMLFGFYMDRPQNALGATGWDWIKGDLLGSYFTQVTQ